MDSKQIVSIFSFLLLFHQSQARTLDSPSPSPSPLFSPSSSPSPSPAPGPSNNGCWLQPNNCHDGSLTACVHPSSTGSKEVILFVKNEGETTLTVNVSMSHAKQMNMNNTQIPPHRIKEVKITVNVAGNASIQIDAGNMGCVIYIVSTAPRGGILDYIPLATHISPVSGASLLILTALVIGSGCACYKCGKRGEGTPYQQLEMAQPASPNNVETAQGWEQDWDDDWRQTANGSSVNGLSSRSTITKRDD
ncbi:hypothetical protein HRI_000991800 [Hibiscus trionum]|uniref:DUF7356 domain-containing protein n=1 Tax=Hibiscus trionum TaxID=183268 RepID=A0A9W7HCC6_HIBTR|nr:hypothetical protein HRI_000991800 [Hibiscus trionum]